MNMLIGFDEEAKHEEAAEKEKTLLENLEEMREKTEKRAQHSKRTRDEKSGVKVEGVDNPDDKDGKMLQPCSRATISSDS